MIVWVRGLISVMLGLLAAICLLASLFFVRMSFDTRGSIDAERAYQRDFQQMEKFVLDYRSRAGKLPSNDDLNAWAEGAVLEYARAGLLSVGPTPVHFCNGKRVRFESAPGDRFALFVWRGEFEDCYASPSGRNTLIFSESEWLKNNFTNSGPATLVLIAFSAALFYGAFLLFPWRNQRRSAQAASSS